MMHMPGSDTSLSCHTTHTTHQPPLHFLKPPPAVAAAEYPMDMWSIGCVVYELFTGHILFPGKVRACPAARVCRHTTTCTCSSTGVDPFASQAGVSHDWLRACSALLPYLTSLTSPCPPCDVTRRPTTRC